MSKEKRRVPKLRFPGFTEDWEQRKLEDVCNVYDGTHQTPRYTNSGVMFVSVEDIETLESNKYITEEDFKSEFKVFPEYGDILLTRIGDVGSANVILDEIKRAYYVSLALLKPKDINSLFLLALLSSSSVQSEIWRRTLHIAFPKKINKNEINKVIVNQPSIPEQKKIGKLFFSLDQTITLHQRKLDNLKLKKKALLQKLFPKNGERYPELRFPGFTDAWEQRKLESILIEYIEKNPGNENLPVLTSSRQGLTKQEDHFGSVQRHDISDYNVIPLGFCTYRNRSDDKTFTFNINRIVPRGLVSKFYPVFEIKNGNADFITEYLNNNTEIIKSLATNAVGTSQVVLSLRTLRNIEITLPLKEEQVAIGDLMRKLDIYITLHQRKLDHLQLQKKALLQQMFV